MVFIILFHMDHKSRLGLPNVVKQLSYLWAHYTMVGILGAETSQFCPQLLAKGVALLPCPTRA